MTDERSTYWSTPDRKTSISVVYCKDSQVHGFVVFTSGRMAQLCATANDAVKVLNWSAGLPSGAAVREFLQPWGYEPPIKKQPTPKADRPEQEGMDTAR